MIAVLLRAVPYTVLYYGISHNNNTIAVKKGITINHIWSFYHDVVDAFFFVKAPCGCGGRSSIPSSNWIIDDEKAIGFIKFVVIIIVIIIIIFFVV